MTTAEQPARRAASVVVLLNPRAGPDRESMHDRLTALFAAAGANARIVDLTSPAHTVAAVRDAVAARVDAVVAGGGDGTVRSVAAALVDTATALGVLPLGTLNHFAKDLGISMDLEEAVQTIVAGHVRRVDVGEVNGRVFLNNSSLGVYPNIVIEREALRKRGYWKWVALAIATVKVVRRYSGVSVRISSGAMTQSYRTPFLLVANNEYTVDGIALGGRPQVDGGVLFAYLAPRLRARDLPRLLFLAVMGRARGADSLVTISTTTLDVKPLVARTLRVALDGEIVAMRMPLHYRIRPGALGVIAPAT